MNNSKINNSIIELIGNTPVIKLNSLVTEDMAEVYVKLESYNPGGSVKDRIALSMIEGAEGDGLLGPHSVIIEPTSGNTGIGLAMICAVKGYRLILCMPETMSIERRRILKAYGAELVLSDGTKGMSGAIAKASELLGTTPNGIMLQQFDNSYNPEVHRKTTAQEILKQMEGTLDGFVSGVGTGGTITGVGEIIKEQIPEVKIVAVEPEKSPVLSGGNPGPHKIQGIGAGFIPSILNKNVYDEIIQVSEASAFETARELAKKEGIFAGVSSGAAVYAALKVAKDLGRGKRVLAVLPDTGERYLSIEGLFLE